MPASDSLFESSLAFWYAASHVARAVVSCRFRIGHFAELLPGATVFVGPQFPVDQLPGLRTLVCIRPYVNNPKADQLRAMRSKGIRVIADYDDLLFDGRPSEFPSVRQGRTTAEVIAGRIGVYRRGFDLFDGFTLSTKPLAQRMELTLGEQRRGRPIAVIPNGLSRGWVRAGRAGAHAYREGDARVLRYFAGSPTHDVDLALIAPALARFLGRHRDVTLELAGHFDTIPSELPRDRIRMLPIRPYMLLPNLLASSWLTLAPLALTDFARCKSDVKFLESAAFGVPTIASKCVVYDAHHGHGLVACDSLDAWEAALESMTDPAFRADASAKALARVEAVGYADRHLDALRAVLERKDAT